jgi:FkbM family methyltransferase
MKLIEINGHGLIEDYLTKGSVVVDLGANKGSFSKQISTLYGCRVYAVEASPITFEETYESDLVQKFNFAICSQEKQLQINISENSEATSLFILNNCEYKESVTIQGVSLEWFISRFSIQSPVTLKLDVEGAELEILKNTPADILRTFSQITVEFHEWLGIGSISEIEVIIEKLKRNGFYHFKLSRTNHGNDLFVNSTRLNNIDYINVRVQMFLQMICRIPKKITAKL